MSHLSMFQDLKLNWDHAFFKSVIGPAIEFDDKNSQGSVGLDSIS